MVDPLSAACARALRVGAALAVASAPSLAAASPAVDGTRNLSMAGATRGSAYGTNAALINPAAMSFSQQFAIEPLYQLEVQGLTHGLGAVVADSLNNPRVALGLGYLFMRGSPRVSFMTSAGEERKLELSHFGHEAFAALSVTIVKRWLSVAIKPKYQYMSLRYRDDEGIARNANDKLNFFGLDLAAGLNIMGWVSLHAVAYNLVGNHQPAFTRDRTLQLEGLDAELDTLDTGTVHRVSDYPLMVAHGLSVFPLRHPDFSLNFDGTYDFTSYWDPGKDVRLTYRGSAEYVFGPVPVRLGAFWDGRGPGGEDDRVVVAGGIAYVKPAKMGGMGIDVGVGFQQAVTGPDPKATVLGLNLGLRIHPDL